MTTSSRIHVTTGVGEPLNTVSKRAEDPSVTLRLLSGVREGGDAPAVDAVAAPDPADNKSLNHHQPVSLR